MDFDDSEIDALIQLAAERGVLVLRDQHMSAQQQADFAHRLGTPLLSPANKGKLPDELLLIQANERLKALPELAGTQMSPARLSHRVVDVENGGRT